SRAERAGKREREMTRTLWTNARVVTTDGTVDRAPEPGATEVLADAGRIVAVGPHLPRSGARIVDCKGRLMTPRAYRLPHASGVRRRPRARVRDAAGSRRRPRKRYRQGRARR